MRLDGSDVLLTGAGRPFSSRLLPALPDGVRRGANQLRVEQRALGPNWLGPLEALLRLLAGEREPAEASRGAGVGSS